MFKSDSQFRKWLAAKGLTLDGVKDEGRGLFEQYLFSLLVEGQSDQFNQALKTWSHATGLGSKISFQFAPADRPFDSSGL